MLHFSLKSISPYRLEIDRGGHGPQALIRCTQLSPDVVTLAGEEINLDKLIFLRKDAAE